ncbi:MAG: ribonuclease H-like domain-containing protein [Chloroflexota bacterium]|nr:ribonuclease H-like domain-containing protein [Chloroflexota bacterium]
MLHSPRVGRAAAELATGHWLAGCDATEGIVAVYARSDGIAHVWRRVGGGGTEVHEERFPNWFLTTGLELLAHMPVTRLPARDLRAAHGRLPVVSGLTVVELEGASALDDAYRYLVLTDGLAEVETTLVEMANKNDGGDATSLADLRGLVLAWPPAEQFLMLSGRTYYKGLQFGDLRRLQFDLETTGLDSERDRIFMIGMRDSSGWSDCLDTSTLSEPELIARFVAAVRARDPDVLENHNIFAFDLPFLVRRAARHGLTLALGRDGSEPELETDSFDVGERTEPFVRWRIRGRQVVDTQHAVRRFGLAAPDLRRHGLKDAARYFGFARMDREYVPGAEIWATYLADPERVRRYVAADVEEVDGLSRRLLPVSFDLAKMLPRDYERIAACAGPTALWEPLLVRAYLHEGRAMPAPVAGGEAGNQSPPADLRVRGVVGPAARAVFPSLLTSVIAANAIRSPSDSLAALPTLAGLALQDTHRPGALALARASHGYLAGVGLLSDQSAAAEASRRARDYLVELLRVLESRGCRIIESDGEQVLAATPRDWHPGAEREVAEAARAFLPRGVEVEFVGQYRAVYARAPHSAILLGLDGSVTLVGDSFRAARLERFGETFLERAAPHVLLGDAVALRRLFLDLVQQLRSAEIPLEDLSVPVTLHKSAAQYRRGLAREEPYEVLLAAGVRSWRIGQRIRYFRARGGQPRLLREGETLSPAEADAEYYVQRLASVYCQQFAQAFARDDFQRIFRVPDAGGPLLEDEAELRSIVPVCDAL